MADCVLLVVPERLPEQQVPQQVAALLKILFLHETSVADLPVSGEPGVVAISPYHVSAWMVASISWLAWVGELLTILCGASPGCLLLPLEVDSYSIFVLCHSPCCGRYTQSDPL